MRHLLRWIWIVGAALGFWFGVGWAKPPAPVQKGCAELGTCHSEAPTATPIGAEIERVEFKDATCFKTSHYVYGGMAVALSCIPKRNSR